MRPEDQGEFASPHETVPYLAAPASVGPQVRMASGGRADPDTISRRRCGLGRVVACTTSLDTWAADWPKIAPDFAKRLVLWAGGAEGPLPVTIQLTPFQGARFYVVREPSPSTTSRTYSSASLRSCSSSAR